jgi:hypothetical protein
MTEGIAFKEFNDTPASMLYYLANADWSVGCPLLEGVKKYQQALAGDVTSFDDEGTLASTNPGRVATRMVYAGSRFCKIVKNEDGNLIGDCECCMKKLGYGCPGLLAVRNHHGLLKKSLEKLTMVVQSKNTAPHGEIANPAA